MLSNKLSSFSKNLSQEFVKHIETTPNLCMYKLGSQFIPESIIFPRAEKVTLINCSSHGILNILNPTIFPNLNKVNYLSTDPGDFKIYERFNDNIRWIFPNKTHDFFDFMVKIGRGTKDSQLIKKYVASKKILDGKNGFDISFECDLNIPGYGIIAGDWWHSQFYDYIVKKQYSYKYKDCIYPGEAASLAIEIKQEMEEERLQKECVKYQLDDIDFDKLYTDN